MLLFCVLLLPKIKLKDFNSKQESKKLWPKIQVLRAGNTSSQVRNVHFNFVWTPALYKGCPDRLVGEQFHNPSDSKFIVKNFNFFSDSRSKDRGEIVDDSEKNPIILVLGDKCLLFFFFLLTKPYDNTFSLVKDSNLQGGLCQSHQDIFHLE